MVLNELAPHVLPARPQIDRNGSHWATELPAEGAALERSLDADIAIVGGGFTGLSAAYFLRLKRPTRRVVLLEAQRCGNGASGRNGAMLLPSSADRFLTPGQDPALDRRLHELTVANFTLLRELSARSGIDAQIELPGALTVLGTEAEAREGRATATRLRAAGIAVEYWERERLDAALGTGAYAAGLFVPEAGQLHPGRMVAVWKQAALEAGAEIFEASAVTHVEEGATHTLTTSRGHTVRTPRLVLATNAYVPLVGFLRRTFVPVWDYISITAPLTDAEFAALGWRSRAPFADTRIEVGYHGVTRDNRVHIGGGPVDYRFNAGAPAADVVAGRYRDLHRSLARLRPLLAGVPFASSWGGLVDMSLDQSPAVGCGGRHGNVCYAVGLSGHGVNLSSVLGRIIADLIAGEAERWRWFPYLNRLPPYIPNEPFRWLAVRTEIAAVRSLGL